MRNMMNDNPGCGQVLLFMFGIAALGTGLFEHDPLQAGLFVLGGACLVLAAVMMEDKI